MDSENLPPRSKKRKVSLEDDILNILFDSDCESEDGNFSDVSVSTSDTEMDEVDENDSGDGGPSNLAEDIAPASSSWSRTADFTPQIFQFDSSSSGVISDQLHEKSSEVDFFLLFFGTDLMSYIVDETNR